MQTSSEKILSIIREREKIHQTELAGILKLEKSTVSRIVKKLNDDNYLKTAGELSAGSAGGRKSILLQLNPDGAYAIGVDNYIDKTMIGLVDMQGKVKCSKTVLTPKSTSVDSTRSFLKSIILSFLKRKSVAKVNLTGIGIASRGIIDTEQGMVISAFSYPGWDRVQLGVMLTEDLGIPVFIDNNARLEAISERCFGSCKGTDDFLCITVRQGIGLGIFAGGKIFRGAHHQAGDMHISLDADGPVCQCGRKGCIEALAGAKVILAHFKNKGIRTVDDICEAVKKPSAGLKKCIGKSGEYLGRTIAHFTELFDPEKVILGGPIIHSGNLLFDAVQDSFLKHMHKDRWTISELGKTTCGTDAGIIGAAVMAMEPIFGKQY